MPNQTTSFLATVILLITLVLFLAAESTAAGRVVTGDIEYGEKYTAVYVPPDEASSQRDDEDYDRYLFLNAWTQYTQKINPELKISLKTQRLKRSYVSRPTLDNSTNYIQLKAAFLPAPKWMIWPKLSYRTRDYQSRTLDNDIMNWGVEGRYKWGVRNNVRFGVDFENANYEIETNRDRNSTKAFARVEKPVAKGLTVKAGAKVQNTRFDFESSSRKNSMQASGSVGFRYEF
ncbi:MAG: hypothetical protein JKX97_03090 [Candidatus Lindowbacteria bacterium]|nr:hypothetical protein [Candidatus Lindowbacteria bacterium]